MRELTTINYRVAQHGFRICMLSSNEVRALLRHSFEPFYARNLSEEPLFTLTLDTPCSLVGKELYLFSWEGVEFTFCRDEQGYSIQYMGKSNQIGFILRTDLTWRNLTTNIPSEGTESGDIYFALNNFLMFSYCFASATKGTLMMHASVIRQCGRGYLFMGKSGTGKSTHSGLWLNHIPGSELLNDDNPIVRMVDGQVWVYGSPWSGKTFCYKDLSAPIGAFVKLEQAAANEISRTGVVKAFAALLPACSMMKWDKEIHNGVCDTLSAVVEAVPVYRLKCLPDAEAARMCYQTVKTDQ